MPLSPISFQLQFHASTSKAIKATAGLDKNLSTIFQTNQQLNKSMAKGIFGEDFNKNDVKFAAKIVEDMSDKFSKIYQNTQMANIATRSWAKSINSSLGKSNNVLSEISNAMGKTDEQANSIRDNFSEALTNIGMKDLKKFESFNENFQGMSETLNSLPIDKAAKLKTSMEDFVDQLENGMVGSNEFNASMEEFNKTLEESTKEAERLKDKLNEIGKIKNFGKQIWNTSKQAMGLTSILLALTEVASQQDRVFTATARMGLTNYTDGVNSNMDAMRGVQKAGNDYLKMARKVSQQTSLSLRDSGEAMSALFENRTLLRGSKDIQEVTKTTALMSQAFGISAGQASEFAKSIMVIGGGSEKDFKAAATSLVNVQTNMGLSAQSAQLVVNQVGLMTRQFRGFGRTSSDIKKVTKEVGNLVASFERVGLEASDASAILNKMMDPSQIGENALMWKGLGMTVQDGMSMMMGDATQLDNLNERMVDMAVKLREQYGQNPIALQEMAKAYGMNLQQVIALSDKQRAVNSETEVSMTLEQKAAANRASTVKQFEALFNQFKGTIQTLLTPILQVGMLFGNLLTASPLLTKAIAYSVLAILALYKGFKLIAIFGKSGGVLSTIASGFKNIINGAKRAASAVGGFVKKMVLAKKGGASWMSSIGGAFKGGASATTDATSSITKNAGPASGGVNKLGAAFKSFPKASQLLALAVAILAIGAAIAGIVLSFTQLAKAMESFDLSQMLGFAAVALAIMIPLMWGLVAAIGALATVGTVGAPGLLAASVAILAIGAAVAGIVLSFSVLIKAFTGLMKMLLDSDKTFGQIVGVFAALAIGILAVAGASMVAAAAIPAMLLIGIALVSISGAALIAGLAFTMLGKGILNIGKGMELIALNAFAATDALLGFMKIFKNGDFTKQAINQMKELSRVMSKFALAAPVLAIAGKISGAGNNKANSSPQLDNVVSELQVANSHLDKIEKYTQQTSKGIDTLIGKMRTQRLQPEYN